MSVFTDIVGYEVHATANMVIATPPPLPYKEQEQMNYGIYNIFWMNTIMWYIQMYYNPAVAILGIISNITAVIILRFSDLAKIPMGHYLLSILVANTLFLVNVILLWVNH